MREEKTRAFITAYLRDNTSFYVADRGAWLYAFRGRDVPGDEPPIAFVADLDALPIYSPPAKVSSTPSTALTKPRTDIATSDIAFPAPLSDYEKIRNAIKDSHTLFEEFFPMHQGVRNTNLFILAFFFRLDGIPEDVAIDYLVAYYMDPAGGFTADEIKRTVKSAYTR